MLAQASGGVAMIVVTAAGTLACLWLVRRLDSD